MLNLNVIETLVGTITFLMAYFIVITPAGAFRAWVADKMGDHTPEEAGFATLNPLQHVDPIGLVLLFIFYFGWSRFVPINPLNIDGSIRWLGIKHGGRIPKLICAYFSDTFAYFMMALTSLVGLVIIFGQKVPLIAQTMLCSPLRMSHLLFVHYFPQYSSLALVIGFLLLVIAYLSIVIGVINLIINCIHLIIIFIHERSPDYMIYNSYITILIPLLLIWFLATPLRLFIIDLLVSAGSALASLFGIK